MKRFILFAIAAALVANVSCSPLRIAMNSTDADGVRTLLTTNQRLMGNAQGVMDIALGARIDKKDTVLAVLVTIDADSGHGVFNKGNLMRIRLNDNKEINLENLYDKEYEEKEETYVSQTPKTDFGYAYSYDYFTGDIWVSPYTINRMVPTVRTSKSSYSYALYLITKPQLNDIITKGVKKLRVEIENSDLDMPETSGVSELFKDMYLVLREEINKNFVRSAF